MNILQIEPATSFSGGVNQMILNSVGLRDRGHKIFIACVKGTPVEKAVREKGFYVLGIDDEKVVKSAKTVREFLRLINVDVVHTHHSRGHTVGVMSCVGRKREVLVVQRSVIFPPHNPIKFWNPRIDAFVANSEAVRSVLIRHFVKPSKVHVVYSASEAVVCGREEARNKLGISGDRFVFGVVGNYSRYKGHDLVYGAFKRLGDRDVMLVLVGRGVEKFKSAAFRDGIAGRVLCMGFRDDARELICGFDCLVVPSLKESFPNVAIEAFFARVPVVGTAVGGIPELLDKGRGLVCKPTVRDIGRAMYSVLNSGDLSRVVDSAFDFAERELTVTVKSLKLEHLYTELIRRRRSVSAL